MSRSLLERRSPSLHRRLILLLLAVGLLPLLIVTMLHNLQGARVLTELANAQLGELAVSSLEKINRDVYDRYSDVQAFASSEAARSMNAQEIAPLMERMTTIYAPAYRLMLVADRSGVVIAASPTRPDGHALASGALLGSSVATEPWFAPWQRREVFSGTTLIQDMDADSRVAALYGDGGYVLGFSHGIFDQRGMLIGVWVNFIDWHVLSDLLAEAEQRPHRQGAASTRLSLVNHVGLLLGGATITRPMQTNYVPPALSLVQSAASSSYDGYDFGLNWVVIATQERGEALATARSQTLQTLLLALGLSGLVVLVGVLAARVITRPLKALQQATERVAQGDLLASVPGGPGEIGLVATAFNSMTAQLRTLYSNLEQQVTARTAELETTLQHLQQRTAELQTSQDQLRTSNQTLAESEQRYRTLFERSQTMLNETELLYRIARSLIAPDQLETLLQLVVDGVVEALDASAVSLITLDSTGTSIADFVRGGVDRELIDTVSFAELSDGLFGWVLRNGQPALSPSQPPDLREAPIVRQRRASRGTGSIIAAPLAYRSHVLGVLSAFNRRSQREWTDRDLAMLTALANQVAVALQNARLYTTLQQELVERRRAEDALRSYQEQLEAQVDLRTSELGQLADELRRANAVLHADVDLARDIQQGLLPDSPPWQPGSLEVCGRSLPASEVGGDFYAFLATPQPGGMVAVGDISGKGVGAALMMALVSSVLETETRQRPDPVELLDALNALLGPRLQANAMNAALALLAIDVEQRLAVAANAGMIAPLLVRAGTVQYLEAVGFPLGSARLPYRATTLALQPDDLLVLLTDGILEAHNAERQLYGFARLEQILLRCVAEQLPLDSLIDAVLHDVLAFSGPIALHDDLTLVAIRPLLRA